MLTLTANKLDALDRMRQTVLGGVITNLLYDGTDLVAEYDGSNALLRRYVHGPGIDEPIVWYEGSDIGSLLGNLTIWSGGFFLATVVYAIASLTSGLVLWQAPKQGTRRAVRWYSTSVISAMLVSTAYLAYWGVIGLRTWA